MSVNFVVKKCTQCAGMLEYIKENKIWRCRYCGAEIERQQQYDGLFTVNNVIRQALTDISFRRMKIAKEHIIEAEKIDSRYLGTIIANLVYGIISLSLSDATGFEKSTISQIKKYNEDLLNHSSKLSEEEEAIYEFIDSSDVYATLLIVFDILNHEHRKEYLLKLINPKEIYSIEANQTFLSYCIKNDKHDLIINIVENSENSDTRFNFFEILEKYTHQENKMQLLKLVSDKIHLNSNDQFRIDNYFKVSLDTKSVKTLVLELILKHDFEIDYINYISNVVDPKEKDSFLKNIDLLSQRKKSDHISQLIVEQILSSHFEIIIDALNILNRNRFFYIIGVRDLAKIETSNQLNLELKMKLYELLVTEKIPRKQLEIYVGYYLNDLENPFDHRTRVLEFFTNKIEQIPSKIFEKYVLDSTIDKSQKAEMIELLLKYNININYHSSLLNQYLSNTKDIIDIRIEVINSLLSHRFNISNDDLIKCLTLKKFSFDEIIKLTSLIKSNYEHHFTKLLDLYITKYKEKVDIEVAKHLFDEKSIVSESAFINLLLDHGSSLIEKVELLVTILKKESNLGTQRLVRMLNNQSIEVNITQAYLLFGKDDELTSNQIINELSKNHSIQDFVSLNNKKVKFKAFITSNFDTLNQRSKELVKNLL